MTLNTVPRVLAASSLGFAVAQAISYTPAASAPQASGISQVLSSSFAGLGIEPSNLFSFTGHDTPNQLSINLLQHLTDYAGAPPHLRIGGNTGDYMVWNGSYDAFDVGVNPNSVSTAASPNDASMFGPGYLEAIDRFPTDTPITFGLNLAYDESDYLERISEAAAGVLDNLNNTKLYSFEIGNEPDLYTESWNGQRTGTWDGSVYTTEWLDRAGAIYRNVLQAKGIASNFFEAAQTASTIDTTFTIDDLVSDGITAEVNGSKYLASWNQHDYLYFVSVSTFDITLAYVMDFDNTVTQFAYWDTQISGALSTTDYPYNLREMACVGPTGLANLSDTFGAALWTMNFYLYAATANISSVEFHMTDNSYGSPWQPIYINEKVPNVRPSYYAMAAVAQLIGSGNNTRIAPLDASTTTNSNVRSYAAYNDDDLTSIVIINAQQANASVTDKASLNFTLSLPNYSGKKLYLSYLSADGADVTSNTTWNGISYEQDSLGTASSIDDLSGQTVDIDSNGGATISVRNSQAIIAHIGSRIGGSNGTESTKNSSSSSKTSDSSASSASSSVSTSTSTDGTASASASSSSGSKKSSGSVLLTDQTVFFSAMAMSLVFVLGSLF